jgi:hypothetical protein
MPEKNKQIKIMLLIAFFTIVVALFFVFDLQKYLTLEYLKSSKSFFISSYEINPISVLGGILQESGDFTWRLSDSVKN